MRIPAMAAVAAFGLAGCGEGHASDAYRKEAASACASADRAFKPLGPRSAGDDAESALAVWRRAADAVAAVEPPAGAREQHADLVEETHEVELALHRTVPVLTGDDSFGRAHEEIVGLRAGAEALQVAGRKAGLRRCGDALVRASNRMLARPFFVLVGAAVAEYFRIVDRTSLRPRSPEATGRAVDAVVNAQATLRMEVGVLEPPAPLADAHRKFRAEVSDLSDVMLPLYDPGPVDAARAQRILRRYEAIHRRFERRWVAYLGKIRRHAE